MAEVRRLLPDAAIRIDANAGWDHDEAMAALEALAGFGLQYAEQPVAGIEGLARVREEVARRGLGVLIAADESVRKESDPLAVARAGAADLIVIKAQPLGGVRRALAVVRDAGLPAVVSSALDTSIGLRQGAALAAALPELPYACGLATGSLFSSDITTDRFLAVNGELQLRDIAADPELLRRHAVERRTPGLVAAAPGRLPRGAAAGRRPATDRRTAGSLRQIPVTSAHNLRPTSNDTSRCTAVNLAAAGRSPAAGTLWNRSHPLDSVARRKP